MDIHKNIINAVTSLALLLLSSSCTTQTTSITSIDSVVGTEKVTMVVDAPNQCMTLYHFKQSHYTDINQVVPFAPELDIFFYEKDKKYFEAELRKKGIPAKVKQELQAKLNAVNTKLDLTKNGKGEALRILDITNAAQKDIYDNIVRLHNEKFINTIYLETANAPFPHVGTAPCTKEVATQQIQYRTANTQKALNITPQDMAKKYPYTCDAGYLLAAQEILSVQLCDANASDFFPTIVDYSNFYLPHINAKRQEITLRRLMEDRAVNHGNSSPVAILIYGGSHDFENTVINWNKKNPDRKIDLKTYTPQAVKKEESEQPIPKLRG